MTNKIEIRESVPCDFVAIESLYPEAFPDEDLLPLVRDLLKDSVNVMSLVGTIDSRTVGHAIFTKCGVVGSSVNAALLGPLAVARALQRQGVGSEIVRTGLRRLEDADVGLVCVLGNPEYYGRFGFSRESLVEPPFRLPVEWAVAWQSQYLGDTTTPCAGKLLVPPQWRKPELWAP